MKFSTHVEAVKTLIQTWAKSRIFHLWIFIGSLKYGVIICCVNGITGGCVYRDFGGCGSGARACLCHLVAAWPWGSHLTLLNFSSLICKKMTWEIKPQRMTVVKIKTQHRILQSYLLSWLLLSAVKKSECCLYYYLFITISCVCLDSSFAYVWSFLAHSADRQNALADDDNDEPWVTSGRQGLRALFPGWLNSIAAVDFFWLIPGMSKEITIHFIL